MIDTGTEQDVTLWMVDDMPVRMFYAGERWTVTDTPTRLRETIWHAATPTPAGLYGWRFQGTNAAGATFMFDVFREADGWHVHDVYS